MTERLEDTLVRVINIADDGAAREVWSALTNTKWVHVSGVSESMSFRSVAAMIADVRGNKEHYMDWYSCGPSGVVSSRIREALKAEGWTVDL